MTILSLCHEFPIETSCIGSTSIENISLSIPTYTHPFQVKYTLFYDFCMKLGINLNDIESQRVSTRLHVPTLD